METLAPRSAYTRDEIGVDQNVPVAAGLVFGILGSVAKLVMEVVEGRPPVEAFFTAVLFGVLGGVFYGLFLGTVVAVSDRRRLDRVHAGDARLVGPPPPGALFRLPCGLVRGRGIVRGVLYVSPRGMLFQPHRPARKVQRDEVMEPLEEIQVEQADVFLPAPAPWAPNTAPGIVVRWPEGRAELLVPRAGETFGRLRGALASLRGAPVGPEAA